MSIKDIKNLILKNYENEEDKLSEQNKSFDHKNPLKKHQILNDSIEKNLSRSHNEKESKLINKNNCTTEKKGNKNDKIGFHNSINSDNSNIIKGNHKTVNIFYKGKEIINDEKKIRI